MGATKPEDEASGAAVTAPAPVDAELVQRIRAGETALFERIMRRHNRRLFRIARSILGDDGEAEEAVQEGYVRAYFRLEEFRGPGGFASWLCRIVTNEALMRRRRMQHSAQRAPVEAIDGPEQREVIMAHRSSDSADPEASAHCQQLRQLLESAIDALPEAYRATYVLREVEQMSVRETAAVLDVDTATVKSRVHRARRLLRRSLQRHLSETAAEVFPFAGGRCDRIVERVLGRLAGVAPSHQSRH